MKSAPKVGTAPQEGMIRTVVSDIGNDGEYEDNYGAKLLKYIPAEVLAAFIPLVALADKIAGPNGTQQYWVWITIGLGGFAVIGYSRWQATDQLQKKLEVVHGSHAKAQDRWDSHKLAVELKRRQPAPYFYVLALLAFGAWALATSAPVRTVVGLNAAESEYIVAALTFVLPLMDATLNHFWRRAGFAPKPVRAAPRKPRQKPAHIPPRPIRARGAGGQSRKPGARARSQAIGAGGRSKGH